MFFAMVLMVWNFVLDVLAVSRLTADEKSLEIMLLRQQLRIAERHQQRGPAIARWEKLPLVALLMKLKQRAGDAKSIMSESVRLFKPATIIGWHREVVRRKWTFKGNHQRGRPSIDEEVEQWIVRLARENPRFGYDKLEGELRKLGFQVSATTIRKVLRQHGIPPAPERSRHQSSWRYFLSHYKEQLLACDFFSVETLMLQTLYVLFFIEHGTRRVHVAGCTAHPNTTWIAQQARQMCWAKDDIQYLIHDRDTKFTTQFDVIFESDGIEIILAPPRAPKANAIAERWVRTVREECLDHLIILNEHHLRRVLSTYTRNYNERRPHQGLAQSSPCGFDEGSGNIHCRQVLGGIIRDYYRNAA